ncbi:MAG: response regulator [Planctomycetota bacterium]
MSSVSKSPTSNATSHVTETPPDPTVFVADDDPDIRDYLRDLLQSVNLPVWAFESGHELLERYDSTWTGCIVTDLRMPALSGLELQTRLKARGSTLPIIFLTGFAEVDVAVRTLKMGAADFLQKPVRGQEMLDSVQRALEIESRKRVQRREHQQTSNRLTNLNEGERAVLELLVDGFPYKFIASKLNLSYKTVEARRARIMKKLGAETQSELYKIMISYALANDGACARPAELSEQLAMAQRSN